MEFGPEPHREEQAATRPRGERPEPARPTTEEALPGARPAPGLSPRSAIALQGRAGNRAVSRLMAQRTKAPKAPAAPKQNAPGPAPAAALGATATPAAPEAAPVEFIPLQRLASAPAAAPARPSTPTQDPKFNALTKDVKTKRGTLAAHPPAKNEADAAAKAAKPPQDDKLAQGKAANAEKMNEAKPGEFNKTAFIAAVNAAIAAKAPKNLEEADEFGSSGKADDVKDQVQGKVGDGKKQSASAIESTTKAPPDTGAAKDKPVTPLAADKPPGTPGAPDPSLAVPDKAPAAATDFSEGPKQVDKEMADAEVTEEQLAKSNEPEFTGALKEKKAGEAHSATAPGEVRAKENATLGAAKAEAKQEGTTAMSSMSIARNKSGQDLASGKGKAQSADEQKRAQVTAKLQTVFDATKTDVEKILGDLDKKVDDKFTKDEKVARDAFTADHKRRMDVYKDKRYSGWTGGLKWAKDKLMGMPSEANDIFAVSRQGYTAAMQTVISGVADLIGSELNAAKTRIAKGRADLKTEVDKLPKDLQNIGKEAAGEFSGKFDELTESVDSKGTELVDTLATKYTDALKSVDEEIASEKEKNKGLVAKAMDAVVGVVKMILELKNLLLGILAKAAHAIAGIIKDPIGFLGNLIGAIGEGIKSFMANIGSHLKKGMLSWLLGTAAKAGLVLPDKFDVRGILMMIASMLGLTWGAIKGRIIAKGVPAEAMTAVEASVPIAQKIAGGGIGAIWEDIKDYVGDLKENLFGKIAEYLIPTVLIAGVTWILSLLNPASAFIKAVKAIIDIVTFIVTKGAQIAEFVNAVLDAVISIAKGGSGGVGALIENALAKSVPVLIGFLAALLGVGGIADKVKKFFTALSKPVMKAVDWVVGKIVGLGKKIWAKIKGKFGKKDKDGKDGKPGDDKDVQTPKRLVEPKPFTIDQAGPELTAEIAAASSGAVIHQTGGDPKQVTKAVLAQHSDARYEKASGTLTLPKVSPGSPASLSALGAQVAAETGVSKVSIKKSEDKTEIWGGINPDVPVGSVGAPKDHEAVRAAVLDQKIVPFMKQMAAGQKITATVGGATATVDLAMFDKVFTSHSDTRAWTKDKFRDAMDGKHEWIPSNYVLEVVKKASDLAGEGPAWIDLQHNMRSDTFQIVFNPSKPNAGPKVVSDTLPGATAARQFTVPKGHVGAVYYPTVDPTNQQVGGTGGFHAALRTAFTGKSTVKEAAQAAHAVAKDWIWDGSPLAHDIHPKCADKNGNQVTPGNHAAHLANVDALFQKFI